MKYSKKKRIANGRRKTFHKRRLNALPLKGGNTNKSSQIQRPINQIPVKNDKASLAMQNTGRILTQSAVNLADKIGTPLVKSLGVDLNESADQTMNKLMVPLESGLAQLKRPRVKKVIKDGFLELVDDAKPAFDKLASDGVSLVTNVAEDVMGPLIGIPRTLGNVADIAETGIGLANKTLGTVSDISNQLADASSNVSNSIENVGNTVTNQVGNVSNAVTGSVNNVGNAVTNQVGNVSNSVENVGNALTNKVGNAVTNKVGNVSNSVSALKQNQEQAFDNSQKSMRQLTGNNNTRKQMGGSRRKRNKTKKRSIFQELHSYF